METRKNKIDAVHKVMGCSWVYMSWSGNYKNPTFTPSLTDNSGASRRVCTTCLNHQQWMGEWVKPNQTDYSANYRSFLEALVSEAVKFSERRERGEE